MADNDYLGQIQNQRLNQQWSNSMAWTTPSWMQGGFKQGTPQGGGSTFRAPNAGVRQSWDGAEMRDTRTRPTNWKGAIELYKESLKEDEDDGSSSGSGSTTPSTPPARAPRRRPAGTRTPAGTATPSTTTPTGGGTPSTTPTGTTPTGTATPTATPAGRSRPRWMPRFSPSVPEEPAPPAPIVPSTFEDLNPNQQRVVTAMEQQRAQRTPSTSSSQPVSGSQPAQTPAFGPIQRTPSVTATNRPARTPASPSAPARPPLTDLQQKAIAGVQQMREQRQNPSASSTSATSSKPATGSRAQKRATPSRIGNFGQNRIDTNLAPFK